MSETSTRDPNAHLKTDWPQVLKIGVAVLLMNALVMWLVANWGALAELLLDV